jgi:hypothetical protein
MQNPFVAGNSVSETEFLGRTREVRGIVSRLSNRGQSIAVVGEPRIGKTSLLRYLSAPSKRQELYGPLAECLIFNYIDTATLGSAFTQTQFWWLALKPLADKLTAINSPALTAAYETCQHEGFGVYVLEKLLAQLQLAGWRIVLMLDEFDNLLNHPVLNKAEFYGGLRSLDTRCESIALLIASRQSLEELNAATQDYSRMGSPYFNHMTPVSLGAFSDKEIHTLLARGDTHFKKPDRGYLTHIAGGHPFLLQSAAYALWESYEGGEAKKKIRWENSARELLDRAGPTLTDTWRLWSPETRQAVTIVALDSLPQLVKAKEFNIESLVGLLDGYTPEIEVLKKRGFLVSDSNQKTCYRLQADVMLWWLAREMIRISRSKDGDFLSQWQQDQQLEGQVKGPDKTKLQRAFGSLRPMLTKGAEIAIEILIDVAMGKFMTGGL